MSAARPLFHRKRKSVRGRRPWSRHQQSAHWGKRKWRHLNGVIAPEQNPDANGSPIGAWNSPGTDETTMRIPNPDPGELWTDINMQLFGNSAPAPGQRPTMVGFVQNYLAQRQLNRQQTYDPTSVMHYFAPAQLPVLPVLSQLAQKFAVCDHWFASAPRSVMTEAADFMCPRCTSR